MKTHRFLALLLCAAMLIAALGATVFAEGTEGETGFHTNAVAAPLSAAQGSGAGGQVSSPDVGDIGGPDRVDDWERQPQPECDAAEAANCPHAETYSIYTGRTYEPTCFAPGGIMIEEYCANCNAFLGEYRYPNSASPALAHKFAVSGGTMKCVYCGITAGEVKSVEQQSACEHDSATVKVIAAQRCGEYSCRVYYCSRCGLQRKVEYDYEDGYHHFSGAGTVVRAATCTEKGISKITCDCGEKTIYRYTEKTAHQFTGDKRIVEPVGCARNGAVYQMCSLCNREQIVEVLKAEGHKKAADAKADSEGADGHTYTCVVCGEKFTEDHQFYSRRNGCEVTWICAICGYKEVTHEHYFRMNNSYTDSNASGHMLTCIDCNATKWEGHDMVPVTDGGGKHDCTKGYRCSVCGWEARKTTSHKIYYAYVDEGHHRGYCTNPDCDYMMEIETHDWGEGLTARDICEKCGAKHSPGGVIIPPEPTATPVPTKSAEPADSPSETPTATPTPRPTVHAHVYVYTSVSATHHSVKCIYCDAKFDDEPHAWGADGHQVNDTCVKCRAKSGPGGAIYTPEPTPAPRPTKAPTPTRAPAPARTAAPEKGVQPTAEPSAQPAAEAQAVAGLSAALPQEWKEVAEKLTFTEVVAVAAADAPVSDVIVRRAELDGEYDAYMALTVEMKQAAQPVAGKVHMAMLVEIDAEDFRLVRVREDGSLEEVEFVYADGILSFDAEDASLYLLVPVV